MLSPSVYLEVDILERLQELEPDVAAECYTLFTPEQLGRLLVERLVYLQGTYAQDMAPKPFTAFIKN